MLDFVERFGRMEPRWQVAMVIGLLWMGTQVAIFRMIVRGVRKFRAAAPGGRRWRVLASWVLGAVTIWVAVGFVVLLAFTVIQQMR